MEGVSVEKTLLALWTRLLAVEEQSRPVATQQSQNGLVLESDAPLEQLIAALEGERCEREKWTTALEIENAEQKAKLELCLDQINDLKTSLSGNLLRIGALEIAVRDLTHVRKDESFYQALLEKEFKSGHAHLRGVGFTDVTTEDAHIEIKRW